MSEYREQALIEAPVEAVWELIGDPRRHPEWFPRIVEVRGEAFAQGDTFAQVTKAPTGKAETTIQVAQRDELRELHLHCLNTGTFTNWTLTEARGGTFVEAQFGIDPKTVGDRLFDRAFGRRFFRNWMTQALESLRKASRTTTAA